MPRLRGERGPPGPLCSLPWAALALLLCSTAAQAIPADARLSLQLDKPVIEKLDPAFFALEVEPPDALHAELLPAGEILLEPKKAGLARVFVFARRAVRVIEVAIDARFPEPAEPSAAAAAQSSHAAPAAHATPAARCPEVSDAACYAVWRERLLHRAPEGKGDGEGPRIVFELEGLQAQAKAAEEELKKAGLSRVSVALSAYGVRLKGCRDEAERRRAIRAIWPALLGPLRLDD